MIRLYWTEAQTSREPDGGDAVDLEFGLLVLDILEAESYEISSMITEHSVESREQITDHQVPQIDRVSVDVVVSERVSSLDLGVDGASRSTVDLGGGRSATAITAPDGTTRTADAFDTLRRLCREGLEVDVQGLRRDLEGWLISSVSDRRDTQTAGALTCTITLQEVSTASASEIDAPAPRVERARRNSNRGRQRGRETSDAEVSGDPEDRASDVERIREDFGWDPETGEVL